ncbi:hypothetical protein SERLADRAFT_386469 [Serpula lacrymans var. lacrymans S7.9]|uniref:Uncharacterized protein n=1 Tax=Serpula lacrymans var. lacrymans (strain S7.9) TaxID=578457 RepID=F8NTW5_SERL9|nr:uncharacterized protein SERLADRAFT_386469 [Serpula lacrymans var. lacrymans S7.9]EGO25093.1 hypothetical protein SERLADRAFT_386469 [Serpula lacrymans var. lacrymans S7.9]
MSGLVLHRDQWLEDSSPSQNPVLTDSYSLSELTNWKGEGTIVPQVRDGWDSSALPCGNHNDNLWLYRVYIRMQEPQKKLQIYQVFCSF